MKTLYRYAGALCEMDEGKLSTAFLETEKKLRAGGFSYIPAQAFQSQIEEIKMSWPDEAKQFARNRAKELAGAGKPTAAMVRQSLMDTMTQFVPSKRCFGRENFALVGETKLAATDLALSTLFRRAPDASSTYSARQYKPGGPRVVAKCSTKLGRLVVNVEDVDSAELFVLALYNEDLRRSWLLGWTRKDDLKACPTGNRMTNRNECPWNKMAHYMDMDKLKPMSAFLTGFKIQEVSDGLLFESLPAGADLPLPSGLNADMLTQSDKADNVDFDAILGLTPLPKVEAEKPKTQPAKAADPEPF